LSLIVVVSTLVSSVVSTLVSSVVSNLVSSVVITIVMLPWFLHSFGQSSKLTHRSEHSLKQHSLPVHFVHDDGHLPLLASVLQKQEQSSSSSVPSSNSSSTRCALLCSTFLRSFSKQPRTSPFSIQFDNTTSNSPLTSSTSSWQQRFSENNSPILCSIIP